MLTITDSRRARCEAIWGMKMITKLIGKLGMMLAVLAAVSLVISPIAPALAATPEAVKATMSHSAVKAKIVQHAKRGEAAILTKRQVDQLARTNPNLHKRLMAAYRSNAVPKVTAAEKQMLAGMSERNLGKFKAGSVAVVASGVAIPWFVWGFFLLVIILIFLYSITGGKGPKLLTFNPLFNPFLR